MKHRFNKILLELKAKRPLINNMTNPVTMNDCANAQLAIGASPMMASYVEEIGEVAEAVDGFNFNIGAIQEGMANSMILAAKLANEMDKPIVLDPVGVGVSTYRKKLVQTLLSKYKISVIKGNVSEIKTIDNFDLKTKGIDASHQEQMVESHIEYISELAIRVATRYNCIVVVTGSVDVVASKDQAYLIKHGHPMMARITGTGCVLSSLIGALISTKKASDNLLEEVVLSVGILGLAGEIGAQNMQSFEGSGTYMRRILDSLTHIDELDLDSLLKIRLLTREMGNE